MNTQRTSRIDILQVIRLFAASMIILYHTGLIGGRGYFGVQVFFVLSGFLAYYSTRKPVSAGRYLLRRCIRLIPLYWIFTVLTFLLLTVRPGLSNMSDADPLHLLKSLLFIPYKGDAGHNLPILAVGWTMQYEMAFTLLFTLSLLISRRRRGLVCGLLLLILTAVGLWVKPKPLFIRYYTSSHLFNFFLGLLAGFAWKKLRDRVPEDRPVLSCLPASLRIPVRVLLSLLAAGAAVFLVLDVRFSFSLQQCFRLGIPALVMIFSLLLLMERVSFPPKLLALCGMTYSIFLVEYFTTSVYKRLLPASAGLPLTLLSLAVLFAVTFALSVIPCQLIEVRLTALLKKLFRVS